MHGPNRDAEPSGLGKAMCAPLALPLRDFGGKLLLEMPKGRNYRGAKWTCELLGRVFHPEKERAIARVFGEIGSRHLNKPAGIVEKIAQPVFKGIIKHLEEAGKVAVQVRGGRPAPDKHAEPPTAP